MADATSFANSFSIRLLSERTSFGLVRFIEQTVHRLLRFLLVERSYVRERGYHSLC